MCLEPWIGYADHHDSNYQFIEKDNMQFLNPECEAKATYSITVLE